MSVSRCPYPYLPPALLPSPMGWGGGVGMGGVPDVERTDVAAIGGVVVAASVRASPAGGRAEAAWPPGRGRGRQGGGAARADNRLGGVRCARQAAPGPPE